MAPVHTFNGEPVDWHTLREIPVSSRPFRLCRCGQSSNKPFCDSSHARNGFDGTETATHDPYAARATVTEEVGEPAAAIADNQELCLLAGFCRTRTTSVWQLLGESTENPAKRELSRDMVWRCPGGRLTYLEDGSPVEPDLPESIAVLPGGPIWVRGGIEVDGSGGHSWEKRNRVTLCRCGGSGNKPFCDGAHQSLHFDER
jgi:CDGSH-type Zn-finger protein